LSFVIRRLSFVIRRSSFVSLRFTLYVSSFFHLSSFTFEVGSVQDDNNINSIHPSVGPDPNAGSAASMVEPGELAEGLVTPQLHVLDSEGRTLRTAPLKTTGLTIGRLPANDLTLDSNTISRYHLRIDWDGAEARVTDLGTRNGTLLQGARLDPQVAHVWPAGHYVQIGPFLLRIVTDLPASAAAPLPPTGFSTVVLTDSVMRQTIDDSPTRRLEAERPGVGHVGVALAPGNDVLEMTPGYPIYIPMTLSNYGQEADVLSVAIEGLPAEWVQEPPPTTVQPNSQTIVEAIVTIPETADSRAGDYPVLIRVRSQHDLQETATAQAQWSVRPFAVSEIEMTPRRATAREQAIYNIKLRNGGNASERYTLVAEDTNQALVFTFGQPHVTVEPGRSVEVPLTVQKARRLLGGDQRNNFTVRATAYGAPALEADGQFVQKSMLPLWALLLPLLLLLLWGGSAVSNLLAGGGAAPTAGPVADASAAPTPSDDPARLTAEANARNAAVTAAVAASNADALEATAAALALTATANPGDATAQASAAVAAAAAADARATANAAAGVAATAQSAIPTRTTPTAGATGTSGVTTTSTSGAGAVGAATGTPTPTPTLRPGEVILSINNAPDVQEGNNGDRTNANFVVTLLGSTNQVVTVRYATSDNSADADEDYEAASDTLTFRPGEATSQTITVPVIGDNQDESNETFRVMLSNPTNATLSGSQSVGVATIIDNDGAIAPTNTSSPASPTPTGTPGPLPVVSFSTDSQTIEEASTTVTVRVNMDRAIAQEVRVPLAVDGSASSSGNAADYTPINNSITIPANNTSASLTFNIIPDTRDEPEETIRISMSTPSNATLGNPSIQTIRITDDDIPQVSFANVGQSPLESAGSVTVQVLLSIASERELTIPFSVGGSATGEDFSPINQSVTFPAGATSRDISITINNDGLTEPDDTIILTLQSTTFTGVRDPVVHTITIRNDDAPTATPTFTPVPPTLTPTPSPTPTPDPVQPPEVTVAFEPPDNRLNNQSQAFSRLVITIRNPNASSLTNLNFSRNLPTDTTTSTDQDNENGRHYQNTCGGIFSPVPNAQGKVGLQTTISLANGQLAGNGECTLRIQLLTRETGPKTFSVVVASDQGNSQQASGTWDVEP
jgi:hypothetical protein